MPETPLEADGLVRHPRPYPTESLFGYILRLAEENGYPTPHRVFALIRERACQFSSRRITLPKLARVAHRDLCELERIAYCLTDKRGHFILGHPVGFRELRRHAKVFLCPPCVRSLGFIEAHWDLELMTGCPVHRSVLLSRCPQCQLGLSWMRPGQLECSCGAILGSVDGPNLPDDEAELLGIIRCKVLGLPVSSETSTGMPISELSALSLGGLLFLMRTLAKSHLGKKDRRQLEDSQAVVTTAAYVLRCFPDNLHKLFWATGEQQVTNQCGGAVKNRSSSIYTGIFGFRDPPETRDFLFGAFLDFAINNLDRGVITGKSLRYLQRTNPKRFITRQEFGERFGLGKLTTLRVLALKNIPTITVRTGQIKTLIDLQQLQEPPMIPGKIFPLRKAAAAIGVSVTALRRLRTSGHFEVKYLVGRGCHEHDVKHFIERLLALNPSTTNKALPCDCITYRAMRGSYSTSEGSAGIIRALLSGEVRVMGNVDGTVGGLFVSRAELQQFCRNDRARQNGNSRTALEVAEEINCTHGCVHSMVRLKLLDGWKTRTGLRISEQSIAKFKKKYVSLVSIAREIRSSPSALLRHWAAAKQMPVVVLKVAYGEGKQQVFVRLKYRDALVSFQPAMWRELQRSAKRKRRLAQKQQRLRVLQEVNQGHITKKQAALELGVSVIYVYQLLARWRAGHDNPLRHRQRGTTVKTQNAGSSKTASR